jgi:glycosyltransferase involved in cell wall biosynthesis
MTDSGTTRPDILLISRCPPYPLHMGDRLIPYHLVRQLVDRGWRIDLLAFYQQPDDLADVPYYEKYFNSVQLVREPARSPLSLFRRGMVEACRFPGGQRESWSPEMWRAIQDRLARHRYDVVHLFGGVHVYEFRDLVRRYPTIIVPYESYTLFLERAMQRAVTNRDRLLTHMRLMMARRYESWMFTPYQRTVVVSDKDAVKLQELAPGLAVEVIPNGVDLEKFAPASGEPDVPTLLFTGNYEYGPNLDAARCLINEIFPSVKRAIPDAELYIVGTNPPEELRAVGLPGVHVTGRVPDLRPYFEGASVYVSPLRLGAGIKNKILEAMAMQTAIVATSLSCDGIAVQDGEHLRIADDPAAMVQAVLDLLQHPDRRRALAASGRRLIEAQYTWQRVAEDYEALYDAVIAEFSADKS